MSNNDIVILGYSIQKPSRARADKGEPILTTEEYQALALNSLLKSVNLTKKDLKSIKYALGVNRPLWPHATIWTSEVIQNLGLSPKLTFISDHGGASAFNLIIEAYSLLKSGIVDMVLLIGADSPMTPTTMLSKWRIERTWRYEINYELPIGMIGPISEVALIAKRHMALYNTKPESLGKISVTFRKHSILNPYGYLKTPLTIEDYLKSPYIAEPIRLLDVVIPINCGYGLMLTREDFAKKIGGEFVRVKGFGMSYNEEAENELREITELHGLKNAVNDALNMAGVSLRGIDFFQLYDDFTIIVLMQFEDLGLTEKGKGSEFVEKNDLTYQGNFPTNTGGGQLSGGQAGTAGGFSLVIEAVMQLLNRAENRQVKGADTGLITFLGGLGYNNNLVNKGVLILTNY